MYKMIAIDLDGTLLDDRHEITSVVRSSILAAKAKGVKVVLCSGRPIGGVRRFIKELHLDGKNDYVIAYNGGLIQNTYTNEAIVELSLGFEDLAHLYELSLELNTSIQYFDYENLYTLNKDIHRYTVFDAYLNKVSLHYRHLEEIPRNSIIPKVMFVDEPEHLNKIIPLIPTNLMEKYTMQSSAPFFYEFVHPKATKGDAVKYLAELLNIKPKEVMCIGDNGNDLSMIQYAGLGVAMGNAIPEIKKIAKYQTLTNNENGVAHVIRKFVI